MRKKRKLKYSRSQEGLLFKKKTHFLNAIRKFPKKRTMGFTTEVHLNLGKAVLIR